MSIFYLPFQNVNNILCSFGCGKISCYVTKHGRYCCSSHHNKCQKIIDRRVEIFNKIDETTGFSIKERKNDNIKTSLNKLDALTGKKISKLKNERAAITKRTKIGDNGKTVLDKLSETMTIVMGNRDPATGQSEASKRSVSGANKRANIIDDATGLNLNQLLAIKAVDTKRNIIDETTGLNLLEIASRKAMDSMKNNILLDGKSMLDHRSEKIQASITTIDERTGLTKIELGKVRARKMIKYCDYSDKLFYQGSYEKDFLDTLTNILGIRWVAENVLRGPTFHYKDAITKKDRKYYSDFFIPNIDTVIEVKSSHYWYKDLENNKEKLDSVILAGYQVFLYLDKKLIEDFKQV